MARGNRTMTDHSNTILVQYSDPHFSSSELSTLPEEKTVILEPGEFQPQLIRSKILNWDLKS